MASCEKGSIYEWEEGSEITFLHVYPKIGLWG